jgi:hypothetical protein
LSRKSNSRFLRQKNGQTWVFVNQLQEYGEKWHHSNFISNNTAFDRQFSAFRNSKLSNYFPQFKWHSANFKESMSNLRYMTKQMVISWNWPFQWLYFLKKYFGAYSVHQKSHFCANKMKN